VEQRAGSLEILELSMLAECYSGRRVLVTGHTGFKGSWLSQWLVMMGAKVYGYALSPEPHERLFGQLDLPSQLAGDYRENVLDLERLCQVVREVAPEFIFHLAAQPLVRKSYEFPVETFATNAMGTVHLLEALRRCDRPCVAVAVTTDKCYENREWLHAYREEDAMGGHDPYSASKGCAELVISSYRRSFFQLRGAIRLASARAGNVIGGGDWAADRIIPDTFRALLSGEAIPIRNKTSTRPWQHVLEPLSGYLRLAAAMDRPQAFGRSDASDFCEAFNFGPQLTSNRTVLDLVTEVLKLIPGKWVDLSNPAEPHEASKLNLAIDKAYHRLGWQPAWDFPTTIERTVAWYLATHRGAPAATITRQQIEAFAATMEPMP
jgi:CDP-glucose 4,6-dehydratase